MRLLNPSLNKDGLTMKTSLAYFVFFLLVLSNPVYLSAQLQIDSNFDSGSIGSYTITNDIIEFTIDSDELNYTYWTNFKVSGILDKEITFKVTNADDVPFLSDVIHESQMVFSYNGDDWYRLTDNSYSDNTYTFTETFSEDSVQIASFYPFSYQEMHDYIDQSAASEWATETSLGLSRQGRDLDLLTITNNSIPAENKKIIFLIGRQHSAEVSSSHMLKGLIDFLISDNIYAHGFRNNFVWYILPMVNPDGVCLGKSRATSEGNDANRDWGNDDTGEVSLVRAGIESIDVLHGIDMFIDWHSQMNDDRWYNFIYSPSGNTFFSVLSDCTDFDSESASGTSSCTPSSCTARGWAMNTGLLTFVFEPTPHLSSWTIGSLNEQGKKTAFAINEYFGMYEVGPVDTRISFVSNTHDFPSVNKGTLLIDVEAMSNDGEFDINLFQGAFQIDAALRTQNPVVTFLSDEKLFVPSAYLTSESYRSSDGCISYEYLFESGTRAAIQDSWIKVVRISIEYSMTYLASAVNWYNGSPVYIVTDDNDADRTGWELEIPELLNDISLPVGLSAFSALHRNVYVQLNWTTESEVNNLGFEIFRSVDSEREFKQISSYQINDVLRGRGSSSIKHYYSFKDSLITAGRSYQYTLSSVDYSGIKSHYDTISVSLISIPSKFMLIQNYPNPFNSSTEIRYLMPKEEFISITIFNALGQKIYSLFKGFKKAGTHSIKFEGTNFSSGLYFCRFETKNTSILKKMLLIR